MTTRVTKQKSSIPLILRDMAPPEGSIFDPARKWEEERERRRLEDQEAQAQIDADIAAQALKKKGKKNTNPPTFIRHAPKYVGKDEYK